MTALIIYIVLAVGVSFACSIFEAVLLSVSPTYVAVFRESHPRLGGRLAELVQDVDRPLAAILSLNTVAHTVGAAGAGAQAAVVFGNAWLGVFSAVLTLAILVFSEIIPKTIGAVYWRELTPTISIVLPWMITALLPLIWLSSWITGFFKKDALERVSREEIMAIADIGEADGVIDSRESDLMKSLLRFREVNVTDVMTPISVVGSLPADITVSEAVEHGLPFSRLPLVETETGKITRYVLRDDLLERSPGDQPISELGRELFRLTEDTELPFALDRFVRWHAHIAIVDGADGNVVGLVTLEDILETLIGVEIVDEVDAVVDMRELARRHTRTRKHLE